MSDDRYADFFLNSTSDVIQYELIEISHPDFSRTYRFVRNARDGLTVDLSADEQGVFFEWYPARVRKLGTKGDMDSAIHFDLGDLGELIPAEIDAVEAAGGFLVKPACRYWAYRSDDLSAPIFGPVSLEVPTIDQDINGSSFDAQAPRLNSNRTGERYETTRFPMLRGML